MKKAKKSRGRYVRKGPRGRRKKDTRSATEVFAENAKLNPRLGPAQLDAVDAVGYYAARITELLEGAKAGQAMRRGDIYNELGLTAMPGGGCTRSALGTVIDHEADWCGAALDQLEESAETVCFYRGGHTYVRLTTAADREKAQLAKERDEKREAESKRVRTALGPNPAYHEDGEDVADWLGRAKPRASVAFEGPAYRKLVALLKREGLIAKQ